MEKAKNDFVEYMHALRHISESVRIYGLQDEQLSEAYKGERYTAFFSKEFLRKQRWGVIPLWEGDLRKLQTEDGVCIELLAVIRSFCLQHGSQFMYISAVEEAKWEYSTSAVAATVAARKMNILVDNPNQLFETTPSNLPYWGHNFLWPDSERFMIYTDGDNFSFIAGNQKEIEELLGVSYGYCKERFVSINTAHQNASEMIKAYCVFCDEFAVLSA